MTVCREAGDKRGEANALWWLGKSDLQDGDIASARNRLGSALRAFRTIEMWEELIGCLEDHTILAGAQGRIDIGVSIAAAAAMSRQRMGLARAPRAERRWEGNLATLRQTVAGADFDAAWEEGKGWQIDRAIRSAQSMQANEPVAAC